MPWHVSYWLTLPLPKEEFRKGEALLTDNSTIGRSQVLFKKPANDICCIKLHPFLHLYRKPNAKEILSPQVVSEVPLINPFVDFSSPICWDVGDLIRYDGDTQKQ